uniref:D-glutamate cyclase n=1 Tax=Cyprinus carpio TaxID=7962 RepID=A0A8C1LC02_CYPCA
FFFFFFIFLNIFFCFQQNKVTLSCLSFREDCSEYCVFENSVLMKKVASLSSYTSQLQDMVTFYLGCSFVRNVEQGKNVSMYKTSVACIGAGQFHCPMVVSMRPVPEDKLDAPSMYLFQKKFLTYHIPLLMILTLMRCWGRFRPLGGKVESYFFHNFPCVSANGMIFGDKSYFYTYFGKMPVSHCPIPAVLITTGFPTHYMHNPPEETDGPSGFIAMAAILQALCKEVVIVTDGHALEMNQHIMLIYYQSNSPDSAPHFLCRDGDPTTPRCNFIHCFLLCCIPIHPQFDHLVAPGCRWELIQHGIRVGGNELGMGKVKAAVKAYMSNGNLIACNVAADFAITAGVSNWGGYAVRLCSLQYVLNLCPVHWQYLQRGLGLSNTVLSKIKDDEMLHILVKYGIRSSKTANLGLEVDGLSASQTHHIATGTKIHICDQCQKYLMKKINF